MKVLLSDLEFGQNYWLFNRVASQIQVFGEKQASVPQFGGPF